MSLWGLLSLLLTLEDTIDSIEARLDALEESVFGPGPTPAVVYLTQWLPDENGMVGVPGSGVQDNCRVLVDPLLSLYDWSACCPDGFTPVGMRRQRFAGHFEEVAVEQDHVVCVEAEATGKAVVVMNLNALEAAESNDVTLHPSVPGPGCVGYDPVIPSQQIDRTGMQPMNCSGLCPSGFRLLGFDRRTDIAMQGVGAMYYEPMDFPGDAVCQQI